jgi:hypothetical protein
MADSINDGLVPSPGPGQAFLRRTWGDILLCGVTLAELSLLVLMTPTFTAQAWGKVGQTDRPRTAALVPTGTGLAGRH